MIKHNITGKQRAFDLLKAIYPDSMTTDRIGDASGMKTHDGARSTCSVLEREGRIKRVGRSTYAYNPECEKAPSYPFDAKQKPLPQNESPSGYDPEQNEKPKLEHQPEDVEPRDLTAFRPFLRPVEGKDRIWGDTIWLRQLLNDLRAEIGEPPIEHYNVLRATRKVMEDLGVSAALSFEGCEYIGENGKTLPMIRFSDDVLFPVVAAVGGKVESRLLHNANVQYNRLKRGERSGGQIDYQLLIELFDRMDKRALEREENARADRAMTQEVLSQVLKLVARGPVLPVSNVRSLDPDRYQGTFRGLAMIQLGIFVTSMADDIAKEIRAGTKAGEFTDEVLKAYLKERPEPNGSARVCSFENDILPSGHRGTVPVPRPEYAQWFAFHDQLDTAAGHRPKWSWCFTHIGKRELLKPERLADIKKWYLQRKDRLFA